MKHIHIAGVCGTFMGGIAQLAKQNGFQVTGSDQHCYPPMSTQLEQAGISLMEGFSADNLKNEPAQVVVGNAMSRGNPEVEYLLDRGLSYTSGPEWLARHILHDKWVIAVAGTHGKTTTSSMVAWILEYSGLNPGFLIGGVPENFGVSARLTDSIFFVVEADEYDTAFFDKRSKFVHYHPRTTVINNLEFDHADIFDDLSAIETQFHHLIRTIPGQGLIIRPFDHEAIDRVLTRGCWTPVQTIDGSGEQQSDWQYELLEEDGSRFSVRFNGQLLGEVDWDLIGVHNVLNGIAAVAAAHHAGVELTVALEALSSFKNVKRRMELKFRVGDVKVFDDFAHHPTAIQTTCEGLRQQVGPGVPIIGVVDARSNTMKMGYHKTRVPVAMQTANTKIIHDPEGNDWGNHKDVFVVQDVEQVLALIDQYLAKDSQILLMSNGSFGGIYQKLEQQLGSS